MTTIIPTTEAVTAVRDAMYEQDVPANKLTASNVIWRAAKDTVENSVLRYTPSTTWTIYPYGVRVEVTIEKGIDGPEAVARLAK